VQSKVLHLRVAVTCLGMAAALGLLPASSHAQQRQLDRILILTPQPDNPEDSTWVREMTMELRTRAQNKFRSKWDVIGTEVMEELLVSSGFPANTIIEPSMVDQVARSLQARGYMYGVLRRRDATPMASYRMVDVSRSGLSGWMTVLGQPGDPPRSFAERVADSLANQVKAADYAKECNARRDRSEFNRARQSAGRAYELYPNHPATSVCLSYVFQATQQPADSMIWVYEKATQGDSLNMDAVEDLAREYISAGDTLKAVGAYEQLLANDPGNEDIRVRVATGYFTVGEAEQAIRVLDEGLQRDPENMRFVRFKQRACLDAENWNCALETSEMIYELDSTMVGNMEFLQSIIGLAGTAGDTTRMVKWYEEALKVEPESQQLLVPYAAVLEAVEGADSALFVYRKLLELNPGDIRYATRVIEHEVGQFEIDTAAAVPIDTAELQRLDSLLQDFAQLNADNDQMQTWVGGQYVGLTGKIAQSQLAHEMAVQWAEKALEYDRTGALEAAANFWLGFSLFYVTYPMDAAIQESKSCQAVNVYERNLRRATRALTIGRSISAETVDQFLEYLQQLAERPAAFRQYFKCSGG
jgi:tetratricopeptide (TPR) repeat protein